MRDAGVLAEAGDAAGPNDLVIALRAVDEAAAGDALAHALRALDSRAGGAGTGPASAFRPRSLAGAPLTQ